MAKAKKAKAAAQAPKPEGSKKLLWQVLIIVFVIIVLITIALTAFLTSETTFRSNLTFSGAGQSKGLSSMLDAKLVCDQKVKNKYKNVLQSSTLNHLSSRYDEGYGGYKLFYNVSVYRDEKRKSGTTDIMYRCYIYNDGDVSETGIIQMTPPPAKARRKTDSNPFGFK